MAVLIRVHTVIYIFNLQTYLNLYFSLFLTIVCQKAKSQSKHGMIGFQYFSLLIMIIPFPKKVWFTLHSLHEIVCFFGLSKYLRYSFLMISDMENYIYFLPPFICLRTGFWYTGQMFIKIIWYITI